MSAETVGPDWSEYRRLSIVVADALAAYRRADALVDLLILRGYRTEAAEAAARADMAHLDKCADEFAAWLKANGQDTRRL